MNYEIINGVIRATNKELTSIDIPEGVTSIGDGAFEKCTSVTSVTIGHSVTSIGERAFHGCTSLESLTIGNGVTRIGDDAFRCCTSLKTVIVPSHLEGWATKNLPCSVEVIIN